MSSPPTAKRVKIEELETPATLDDLDIDTDDQDGEHNVDNENNCSICLQPVVDRTVIPKCSHEFCFECLLVWTEQSRRCPLCSQSIEQYLIHSIRSRYDYRKHYLLPLRTSPPLSRPAQNNTILQNTRNYARRRRREHEWGTRLRENDEQDKLERSIAKRRWIYRHDLYAKHVASNAFTKYRPYPTPTQFSASHELISRTTTFLRRELQVWEGLDVEFLTTLILSLMKAIDIRSESAVKLIAEFLDMDAPCTEGGRRVNAEHFAHEVYCYVRSPYKDLFVYDTVVQYEYRGVSPLPDIPQSQRWRQPTIRVNRDPSPPSEEDRRRRARAKSRSSERSVSWSPSGRRYSPPTQPNNFHSSSTHRGNNRSPPRHPKNTSLQDKGYGEHFQDVSMSTDARGNSCDNGYSSSEKEVKHDPISVQHLDVKGKRKVSEIELDNSSPAELAVGGLEAVNHRPILAQVSQIPHRQETFSSSKVPPRPPRNKSLLDSVKAHLGVNGGHVAASSRTRHQQASHNPNNLSLEHQEMAGETVLRIDDRSKQRISTHLSQRRGKQSPINETILASDIAQSRLSSIYINNQATAVGTSTIEQRTGSDDNDTHPSPDSPKLMLDQRSATTFVDDGVHRQNIPPTTDGNLREVVPKVDHSPPRVNSLLQTVEKRTKLLARLDLEKTQASLVCGRSDTDENSRRSADAQHASATRKFDQNGGSPSVDVSTKDAREVFGIPCVTEGSLSVSVKSHSHGQSDPDFASVSVAEESRAREAKLRTRAQLRVRLAAEKRLIDGS